MYIDIYSCTGHEIKWGPRMRDPGIRLLEDQLLALGEGPRLHFNNGSHGVDIYSMYTYVYINVYTYMYTYRGRNTYVTIHAE